MDNQDAPNTPERKVAVAKANSFFGIRPGTSFTTTVSVFDGLPEEERPLFTFEYMTSSTRQEYAERMALIIGERDEVDGQALAQAEEALKTKRKEHDALNVWLVRKHLKKVERYPDANDGSIIESKLNADGTLSDETWEAISVNLRPHLTNIFITRNYPTDVEESAVKS